MSRRMCLGHQFPFTKMTYLPEHQNRSFEFLVLLTPFLYLQTLYRSIHFDIPLSAHLGTELNHISPEIALGLQYQHLKFDFIEF